MNSTSLIDSYRYTREGIILVITILMLLITLSACRDRAPYSDADADSVAPAPTAPAITQAHTVAVTLFEYSIEMPDSLPAGPTTFTITNAGAEEHGFEVKGPGVVEAFEFTLQPGERTTYDLALQPGTYRVYCPVKNHEEPGMGLDLTVHDPHRDAI